MLGRLRDRLGADVYLICDQFEELTLYQQGGAAKAFAAELGRIVASPDLPVSVLISIREDALARLDRFSAQIPGILGNRLRLDHLTTEAAREAIEGPVGEYDRLVGADEAVTVSPELVIRLLDELSSGRVSVSDAGGVAATPARGTIETPFLQLVMTRLWSQELSHGSQELSLQTLIDLGGAEGIVRTHFDAVMAGLDERQQDVAAAVLRYLVTPSGTKIAQSLETLAYFAGLHDRDELREVLEALAGGDERILRPVPPPVDEPGPTLFEVFHDVLAPAVLDWQRRHVLLKAHRQAQAELVRAKEVAEERQRASRRQLRITQLVAVVAILLLVSGVLGVVAKRASDDARSRVLLSQYARLTTVDQVGALRAALAAYDARQGPDTEMAVRNALDADLGLRILQAKDIGAVFSVAGAQYSANARWVVSAGRDGHARVFNPANGKQVRDIAPRPGDAASPLTAAVFDPTGQWLLTAAASGRVRVIDAESGAEVAVLGAYRGPVHVQWDPSAKTGRVLVSLRSRNHIPVGQQDAALYDVSDPGQPAARFVAGDARAPSRAYAASFGATGTIVVTHDDGGTVSVWDAATAQRLARSTIGRSSASPVIVRPDDSAVAFLCQPSNDNPAWTYGLWEWKTPGKAPQITKSANARATKTDLVVSRDRSRVVVGLDNRARVYDVMGGDTLTFTPAQESRVMDVDISPDGKWFATAAEDGTARLWLATRSNENRSPVSESPGHRGLLGVRFDPSSGATLLTSGAGGVRTWSTSSTTSLVSGNYGWVVDGDVTRDGRHILTAAQYGYVDIWPADGDQPETEYALPPKLGFLSRAGFALDDSVVVVMTSAVEAAQTMPWPKNALYTPPTPLPVAPAALTAMAVSPDGGHVAASTVGGQIVVWDLASRQISPPIQFPGERLTNVIYVPGTSWLAISDMGGKVRLWDLDAQRNGLRFKARRMQL